jgi:hypothetical protein
VHRVPGGEKAARDKGTKWLAETKTDDDPQSIALRLLLWKRLGRLEEEWQPLLRRLAACSEWLLLSWVPVVGGSAFTVLQRAQRYHGTEYVSWVFGRDEFLTVVEDAGFELVREFVLLPRLEIAGAPEHPALVGFLAHRRARAT